MVHLGNGQVLRRNHRHLLEVELPDPDTGTDTSTSNLLQMKDKVPPIGKPATEQPTALPDQTALQTMMLQQAKTRVVGWACHNNQRLQLYRPVQC